MDPQIKEIIEAAIYTLGAAGGLIGTAYVSFKELYKKRELDSQREARNALAVRELLDNPGFKTYIETRKSLAEKVATDPHVQNAEFVERVMNSTFGRFNLGSFFKFE